MRRLVVISLLLPVLLVSCGFSGRKTAGETAETDSVAARVAEDTANVEAGSGTFSAEPVPEEVLARMKGKSLPESARIDISELSYLKLSYVDFNNEERVGEMVCNKAVAEDLLDIFRELFKARYQIESIKLIDDFDASDERSMEANNTSCFCYREMTGTSGGAVKLSVHALGRAVDINPLQNPYVKGNIVEPSSAQPYVDRSLPFPHKIDSSDLCCRLFKAHGFDWGGDWKSLKDWQHFEKLP